MKFTRFCAIDRLENEFLDERGHAAVGNDPQCVGPLLTGAGSTGLIDVQVESARSFLKRVGRQPAADGRSRRGSVGQIEPAVVLGAFDDAAFDQAVGQVGVAVGADPVGGEESTLAIAAERVGLLGVIEADDVFRAEVGGGADFDPALLVGLRVVSRSSSSTWWVRGGGSFRLTHQAGSLTWWKRAGMISR